ncbi:hypothetical protein A8L34_09705 [Bacillus sp. FJAT-27264]|uniref:hypothetical protein n=1 Tax=Paenibacillus sp. (strain DSM 101736 / FJAT-27264) TaxID=1850362 RepID=UPI000807A7F8|nr:hypothetical protein [Bacillus sp. FJAT-27264]OBZ14223.1 hypothetical protein A8L34_09705 [Bacillus sp. FJAT-27264]
MQIMSKDEIFEKFGKPNEVVRDDSDGYIIAYNAGFIVSGNAQGAKEITLQEDAVKKKSTDTYKIFDVTLGSSFADNVARLGKPNLTQEKDGTKHVMYLTKENYLLVFSTKPNNDVINTIQYSAYDSSKEASSLDLSNLLGLSATEDELKSLYTIKDKSNSQGETMYALEEGFEVIVDNNNLVRQLVISSNSIFNIHGIRTSGSLDKAHQVFGEPVSTSAGVRDTTQYSYNYKDGAVPTTVVLSVDSSNKIGYIQVTATEE